MLPVWMFYPAFWVEPNYPPLSIRPGLTVLGTRLDLSVKLMGFNTMGTMRQVHRSFLLWWIKCNHRSTAASLSITQHCNTNAFNVNLTIVKPLLLCTFVDVTRRSHPWKKVPVIWLPCSTEEDGVFLWSRFVQCNRFPALPTAFPINAREEGIIKAAIKWRL